jgi:hypothetical protein
MNQSVLNPNMSNNCKKVRATLKDIFEQMIEFRFSGRFKAANQLIADLLRDGDMMYGQ